MKNFFIIRLLRWGINKADGKKTVTGFVIKFCVGILGILRVLYPEVNLTIPTDFDESFDTIANAFIGVGIGHKVHKINGKK